MQPMNHLLPNNQLSIDSADYAASNVPFARAKQNQADYELAYMAGAEQLLQYLEEFTLRVEKTIPLEKCSEFERGQVDGIRWALDSMKAMFGRD